MVSKKKESYNKTPSHKKENKPPKGGIGVLLVPVAVRASAHPVCARSHASCEKWGYEILFSHDTGHGTGAHWQQHKILLSATRLPWCTSLSFSLLC